MLDPCRNLWPQKGYKNQNIPVVIKTHPCHPIRLYGMYVGGVWELRYHINIVSFTLG